jgi:hypothetical protein
MKYQTNIKHNKILLQIFNNNKSYKITSLNLIYLITNQFNNSLIKFQSYKKNKSLNRPKSAFNNSKNKLKKYRKLINHKKIPNLFLNYPKSLRTNLTISIT